MVDSTYIPAYVYKFKTIFYPSTHGYPKPRDTSAKGKAKRDSIWNEAKKVSDKAWQIDSQYIKIYEFKFIIDGWEHRDTAVYHKLQGELQFKKELHFNDMNLKCRPNDDGLYWDRAQIFYDLCMYDSALICADKANFGWQDSLLKLKRSIFIKTSNKLGVKHIENDLKSLKWQKQNLWINSVENEILKASEDCCIRVYCLDLKEACRNDNVIQFHDLKARCKNIMKRYSRLKPFENKSCHEQYGKCKNVWHLY